MVEAVEAECVAPCDELLDEFARRLVVLCGLSAAASRKISRIMGATRVGP